MLQKQEQLLNTLPFFSLSCFLQLSNALETLRLAALTSLPWSAFTLCQDLSQLPHSATGEVETRSLARNHPLHQPPRRES